MTSLATSSSETAGERHSSWTPLLLVTMAQLLLAFNVGGLKVSIDAIASSLATSSSTVKTALVTYLLVVAGFILAGHRFGQLYGVHRVFRAAVGAFAAAMTIMAVSPGPISMIAAQVLAGIASAALIPTLAAIIAHSYEGKRKDKAMAWLGGTQAIAIGPVFLVGGYVATVLEWRYTFAAIAVLAAAVYVASGTLKAVMSRSGVIVDRIGIALAACAIALIGIGFDNLTDWGPLRARPTAPFSVLGLSPAPLVIAVGVLLVHAFVVWSRRQHACGRTPLVAPEVVGTPTERSALLSMFAIGAIGAGVTFLIPLYIEIVQGRNSLYTAVAMIPYTFASLGAAVLVVRLHARMNPRRIAQYGFVTVAVGLTLLGATVRNDWSDTMVVVSLSLAGAGEGALATLLFGVLVASVPRDLAEDVGSVCGSTSYLGAGVGTALAGALVVGVLGSMVDRNLASNSVIPEQLRIELELDRVAFVSNDHLQGRLESVLATPEQVDEALRINTQARLVALKVSFFALAGLALLSCFPAVGVPDARGVPHTVSGSHGRPDGPRARRETKV